MNCTNCGAPLAPGTNVCPNCGTGVVNAQQPVAAQPVMPQPTPQPVMQQPAMQQPVVSQSSVQPQQPVMQQPMAPMPGVMPQPSPIPVQQQPAPQPAVGAMMLASTPGNNGSKKGIIIPIVIVLLVAVLGFGGYFIYDKVQENKLREEAEKQLEKYEDEVKDREEMKEKLPKLITLKKETKLPDGSLLLLYENKSDRHVTVEIELEFYDSAEKILGTSSEFIDIAPNSESYGYFGQYSLKEGYATYKTNLSINDFTNVIDVKDVKQNDLTINDLEDELVIQYSNKKDKVIGKMDITVLYYSNNELVYVASDSDFEIEPGSNANFSIYLYGDEVQYDRYEVFTTVTYNRNND